MKACYTTTSILYVTKKKIVMKIKKNYHFDVTKIQNILILKIDIVTLKKKI